MLLTGGGLRETSRQASGDLLENSLSEFEKSGLSETQAAFFVCIWTDLGIKIIAKR
jgi:hypothetical protein